VEFIGRFLQHLIPKGMHHIRRYGWMARRRSSEKFAWLEQHLRRATPDVAEAPVAKEEAVPLTEDELPSRPCRYCEGKMQLTDSSYRPRVNEIMGMPLSWFSQLQAGPIVTLGEGVPEKAKKRGKDARAARKKEKTEASCELNSRPTSAYL
jgi:hypothetical protein